MREEIISLILERLDRESDKITADFAVGQWRQG